MTASDKFVTNQNTINAWLTTHSKDYFCKEKHSNERIALFINNNVSFWLRPFILPLRFQEFWLMEESFLFKFYIPRGFVE